MPLFADLRGDLPHASIVIPSCPANVPVGASYVVPFNALITAVKWVPGAAITANGANFFTLSFFNRGPAGAGSTAFATARSYAATNSVLATPETITLSGTAANLLASAGDVISCEVTHSGTGLICPGGLVAVTLRAR